MIAHSPGYWLDVGVRVSLTADGFPADQRRSEVLAEGLTRSIARLKASGHRPIVVIPLVQLADVVGGPVPSTCTTLRLWKGDCFQDIALDKVSDQRDVLEALADRLGDQEIPSIDMIEEQCAMYRCGLWIGDLPIYADNSHVSSGFSRLTAPYFTSAIAGIGRREND